MKKIRNCPPPHASIFPKETLEISDRKELLIAGVTGIEDYHTEKARIRTSQGIVEISGDTITLCWSGEKRLLLRGNFKELHFEYCPMRKGGKRY